MMQQNKTENPFPIMGYKGPSCFCDREDEVKQLKEAIVSGRSITLIAPRRMGKTALVHHFFHTFKKQNMYKTVYLDVMPTTTFRDLASELSTAIARAFPENTHIGRKIWQWIKGIRPVITYDPYTNLPSVSVDFSKAEEQQASVRDALKLLDQCGRRIIIALDEFQQITQYPEKQTEAWLRTQMQTLQNTVFIFSGSQQTLLSEMFFSVKRPFYDSTQLLPVTYISHPSYQRFIMKKFREGKRDISEEDTTYILDWCRRHTYYVQTLCNRLFGSGKTKITRSLILAEIDKILKEQENLFYTFRDLLTSPQWDLLEAIAKEDRLYKPTAAEFIRKHDLTTAGTVKRSLSTLLETDMILQATDENGQRYYQVYHVFLSRWLERHR